MCTNYNNYTLQAKHSVLLWQQYAPLYHNDLSYTLADYRQMSDQMVSLPGCAALGSHFAPGSPGCSFGCKAWRDHTAAPPKPPAPWDRADLVPLQQAPARLQSSPSLPQSPCDQLLMDRRRSFGLFEMAFVSVTTNWTQLPPLCVLLRADISDTDLVQKIIKQTIEMVHSRGWATSVHLIKPPVIPYIAELLPHSHLLSLSMVCVQVSNVMTSCLLMWCLL